VCEDRARYYHPGRRRFTSEDPLGFGGGDVNFYAYTWNSPANYTDPDGEFVIPALAGAAARANLLGAGTSALADFASGRLTALSGPRHVADRPSSDRVPDGAVPCGPGTLRLTTERGDQDRDPDHPPALAAGDLEEHAPRFLR
jgi:uncharacterized protein RhaS with RHS repeats